MANYMFINP